MQSDFSNLNKLYNHFNYTKEKVAFCKTLSDEDLLFVRDLLYSSSSQATEANNLKAKKIDQILTQFESPMFINSWKQYLASWIWSPSPSSISESEKDAIIKQICDKFEPHMSNDPLSLLLSFEPEIGMYEEMFKEPINDVNAHKNWRTNQDNYWKQIGLKIGCPIPKAFPVVQKNQKHFDNMTAYVKNYIAEYKEHILQRSRLITLIKFNKAILNFMPAEIKEILSKKPTVEGFLKVKEWEEAIDTIIVLDLLEDKYSMWEDPNISLNASEFFDYKNTLSRAKNFDHILDHFIHNGHFNKINNVQDKILYLSSQGLSSIPSGLSKLTFLTSINLSENRLKTIPESFGNFLNLESLRLTSNEIEFLPDSLQKTKLKHLDLSLGPTATFPQVIKHLTSLITLNIKGNKDCVLEDLGDLTNLTNLLISEVKGDLKFIKKLKKLIELKLDMVESEFTWDLLQEMKHLKYLGLIGFKQIKFIPKDISRFVDLNYLILRNNQIEEIPDFIGNMNALRCLDVSNNPIKNLTKKMGNKIVYNRD